MPPIMELLDSFRDGGIAVFGNDGGSRISHVNHYGQPKGC